MKRQWILPCVAGLCLTAGSALGQSANWSSFRGPFAGGVADGVSTPTEWNLDTGENVRWQVPIPGLAHASPIVWGDRIFVATVAKQGKADLRVGLCSDIQPVTENDVPT